MAIQLNDITLHHEGQPSPTLKAVRAEFAVGQIHLLVGAIGSGKSSLLNAIGGLLPLSEGRMSQNSGSAHTLELTPTSDAKSLQPWLLHMAHLFQFPEAAFCTSSVAREFRLTLAPYAKANPLAAGELPTLALAEVGLPASLLEQPPLLLSGGQKRRLALALESSTGANWLLCDEPTVGMDPSALPYLTRLLCRWRDEHPDGGVIVATHDLEAMFPICDRVFFLGQKNMVRSATQTEVIAHPEWLSEAGVQVPTQLCIQHLFAADGIPEATARWWSLTELTDTLVARRPRQSGEMEEPVPTSDTFSRTALASTQDQPEPQPEKAPYPTFMPGEVRAVKDVRSAWLSTWMLTIACFATHGPLGSLAAAILAGVYAAAYHVPWRRLFRTVRPLIYLTVASVALAGVVWQPHGSPFPLTFNAVHATTTLLTSIRLFAAMTIGLLVPLTASERALQTALQRLLRPVERLRVPTAAIAFGATLTLQFLPQIRREWQHFAQISLARRKRKITLWALPTAVLPMTLSLLQSAEDVADTLAARGIHHFHDIKQPVDKSRWQRHDWWHLATAALLFGILIAV
jgi:energy-coupling factor transporter ATP-binding protein EcfA2/energy-coupling factor transporter transmembrane protein EcfT